MSRPTHIGSLVGEFTKLLPEMSDEEWARHDAKVAAGIAEDDRRAKDVAGANRKQLLRDCGCSKRSIECLYSSEFEANRAAMQHALGFGQGGIFALAGGTGCGKSVASTW